MGRAHGEASWGEACAAATTRTRMDMARVQRIARPPHGHMGLQAATGCGVHTVDTNGQTGDRLDERSTLFSSA